VRVLRCILHVAGSLVLGAALWILLLLPIYALEGGESCTIDEHCSLLGDIFFGWPGPFVFALVGAVIWGFGMRRLPASGRWRR
jgi:hypothetical protein